MDQEKSRLILRNMKLLIMQLEIELDSVKSNQQPLVESIKLMLKSIEINLKEINEREKTN
jgi:hypothetical protein